MWQQAEGRFLFGDWLLISAATHLIHSKAGLCEWTKKNSIHRRADLVEDLLRSF